MDQPIRDANAMDADWASPPDPPRQPGPWSGLGVVLLYFVLQVVVAVLLMVVVGLGYGFVQGVNGASASLTQWLQAPDVRTGMTVAALTVTAVLMLWLLRRFWPAQWRVADPPGFGWVMPRQRVYFVVAVLAGVAIAVLGGLLTQWLAQGHTLDQDVAVMGRQVTLGMRVALAVLVVCVAPVVEELLFRGVLLSGLMRHMHVRWATLISALVFGCVHLPDFGFAWYAIPTLVMLGVALAVLRLRSRSLWPAVIMHASNNLLAVIGWFVLASPQG